jgi:dTDP-4-dehydrorhamnose 3,5-epimerase
MLSVPAPSTLRVERFDIAGPMLFTPVRHEDQRGFFSETFNAQALADAGVFENFVQDNHSRSEPVHVLRGLHFQISPLAQSKLVRVVRGAILDVCVDLRRSSPTYARHVKVVLSQANWQQLYVPVGFAHGFLTLEPQTEVVYKVSRPYSPEHERGIRFDDPDLSIDWGVAPERFVLSSRDARHPPLRTLPRSF